MINGLGLFASLAAPEAAPPPAAPADDPAAFAAALVAALGLQQPVQVTVAAPRPVAEGEEIAEDEEQVAEGDAPPEANAAVEGEGDTVGSDPVGPVGARVTPDPEAVEESETFDRIPVASGKKPRKESAPGEELPRARVDRVSDEPAVPAPARSVKLPAVAANHEAVTPVAADAGAAPVAHDERPAPVMADPPRPVAEPTGSLAPAVSQVPASPVHASRVLPVAKAAGQGEAPVASETAPAEESTVGVSRPVRKAPREKVAKPAVSSEQSPAPVDRPPVPTTPLPMAAAPVVHAVAPRPDAPSQEPPPAAPEIDIVPRDQAVPRAAAAPAPAAPSPVVLDGRVPPQSVQERTARAMAENVRVGRQLAELLGEESITEFKVELGNRPTTRAKPANAAPQLPISDAKAPVARQQVPLAEGSETIAGPMVPREELTVKPARKPVQGTLAQEAIEPVIARPFAREPVTITTLTSRSEIVRMVANASLATSPNLTQTEGNPAVAKTPAPSVTPSLPDVRQELPGVPPRDRDRAVDDREPRTAREAGTSADASPSSIAAAGASPANKPAVAPENDRASREARNLPSPESTEQKAAGSADRVTLRVADDEGRQTRIRVSVTGNQIRAVITPPDSMSARQLEQRMDQLHETLVRQGFTDPKVVVRTAPEVASDAAALAGATNGSQERSTVPAGRDQPAGDQRQGRGQREQDRGDGHRHPQGHSRERDPRDRRR